MQDGQQAYAPVSPLSAPGPPDDAAPPRGDRLRKLLPTTQA